MKYNLTDIWENVGRKTEQEIDFDYENIEILGEKYQIINPSKVKFSACSVEKGKADVICKFSFETDIPCSRCLKTVRTKISVAPEFIAISPELENESDEEDNQDFIEKYIFDTDKFILSELLLGWPSKILCKENCKGICLVCGTNLNEGECGCNRVVPNPAFAGLSELLKFD